MGDRKAIPTEDRWINSDSQILAKVKQSPHKQGILCSVTMPWGDEFQAVVEKWDAKSAIAFCEHVRSNYNARRAEEEAKQAQRRNDKPVEPTSPGDGGEKLTSCEVSATAPEKAVQVDFTDRSSVAARVDQIRDREAELFAESERLRIERTKLLRIMDVLDAVEEEENASQDDGPDVPSVPTETPPRQGDLDGVDREPREDSSLEGGASDTGSDDSEV